MPEHEIVAKADKDELERKILILRDRVARWTEDENLMTRSIPDLYFFRREAPSEPETVMYETSICVLAQGAKRVHPGDGSFEYDPHHFLAASIDIPTVVEVFKASPEEPCLGVVLTIDRSDVSQLMLESQLPAPSSRKPTLGISAGVMTVELLDAFCRLVGLLDSPEDVPVLAPVVKREILYRLLMSEQGARLRQIATAGSQSHQISQAIEWLKANYTQPLKVETLASQVNMSTSTFHHHFRALTARSPLQFQKWLRLNEARRLMLVDHLDASTAAFRVGYESASQFSREYSRLFGKSPVKDISSLRARYTPTSA